MVKRIIYTQKNGIAAVIAPGPTWIAKRMAEGNTEDEALELLMIKSIKDADERATAKISQSAADFPSHRKFRNAWKQNNNKVAEDMDLAKPIHMNRIREARNAELAKEDITFQKAIETDDASAKLTIATKKQTLRDIPQKFDLSGASDGTELDKLWPSELPESAESFGSPKPPTIVSE